MRILLVAIFLFTLSSPARAAPTDPCATTEVEPRDGLQEVQPQTRLPARGELLINELMPHPTDGAREWVEIKNVGLETIVLDGLVLADAADHRIELRGSIVPLGLYSVTLENSILNNSGDYLALRTTTGAVIDEVVYGNGEGQGVFAPKPEAGLSLARFGAAFVLGKPTPGAENEAAPTVEVEPLADRTEVQPRKTRAALNTNIEEAKELPLGEMVRLKGVVATPPGVIGKRTIYLVGSGGLRITFHGFDPPSLKIGEEIQIEGKLGTVGNERRVAVSKPENVKALGTTEAPTPDTRAIAELGEEDVGSLVEIQGTVTEKIEGQLLLNDGDSSLPVVIKSASQIDLESMGIGGRVSARGVLIQNRAGLRLLPRGPEDITVIEPPPPPPKLPFFTRLSILTLGGSLLTLCFVITMTRQYYIERLRKAERNQEKEPAPLPI